MIEVLYSSTTTEVLYSSITAKVLYSCKGGVNKKLEFLSLTTEKD